MVFSTYCGKIWGNSLSYRIASLFFREAGMSGPHPPPTPGEGGGGRVMNDSFLDHAVRASLIDYLDQKVTVVLRDGKNFIGTLRTFDQYSNVMLEAAFERKIQGRLYADFQTNSPLIVVRGENIVLLGTIDEKTNGVPENLTETSQEEILKLIKKQEAAKQERQHQQQLGSLDDEWDS
eukprot:g62093.t1